MTRNLKALGLALVAVFALSAVAATAASAQNGMLTSTGPVKLTATDIKHSVLKTSASEEVICHGHYSVGEKDKTVVGQPGTHPIATPPLETLTVSPKYTTCHTFSGATTLPVTVTMNGCDYLIHIGPTVGGGPSYSGTADIVCEAGKVIEIHIYQSTDTKHEKATICTVTVGPQTGLTGATAVNVAGGTVKLAGSLLGVKTEHHGILCGGTSTPTAEEIVETSLSGKNAKEETTAIELSHK